MAKQKKLTAGKARKMLHDDSAQGHALTSKQRRFFGMIAGGGTPTRTKKRGRSTKQIDQHMKRGGDYRV